MGISSIGISSGLNVEAIITKLIQAESRPLFLLKSRQAKEELKNASVLSLNIKLSAFESAVTALNSASKYNVKNASVTKTSTGVELLTVSASETAVAGNNTIKVNQLAKASKLASQGFVDQGTTAIASAAGTFKFKVGSAGAETTINVGATTTLEQFRDAINNASAGVTASIINDGTGSNPYRLALTSNSTGSANSITITTNNTNLDFANKKIESAFAFTTNSYSGTVASNSGNFYTGTANQTFLTKITTAGAPGTAKYKYSTDGGITFSSEITTFSLSNTASQYVIDGTNNQIAITEGALSGTATITAATYSADGLATAIKTALEAATASTNTYTVTYNSTSGKFDIARAAGADTLTLKFSDTTNSTAAGILGFDTVDKTAAAASATGDFTAGNFIDGAKIANSTNGRAKLIFGAAGTLAVDDKFSVDVFNPAMQTAQDAVIDVDGAVISKSSNTITDVVQGVTMNLLKTDTNAVTLTVSRDTTGAKANIKGFVESYNTLVKFISGQLSADPKAGTKGPLAGDFTLLGIRNRVNDIITGTVPGLSSASFTNFAQIGITLNSKTGEASLDESKLGSALDKDPNAVAKLFIGTATPSDPAIKFVSKTAKTQAGAYSVSIAAAPEQATLLGDNDVSGGITGSNEILTFKFSKDNTNTSSAPTFTTFSVTLSVGEAANSIVNTLNSAFTTNKVGLSASNEGGKVRLKSTDYGKDIFFQVTSDSGAASGKVFNNTTTRNDAGVDIVGSLNNHSATGKGNVITGGIGFLEEGLQINTTSSQTGGLGTIAVSLGVADRLVSILPSFTDPSSKGILTSKADSIQKVVDGLKARQKRIEDSLIEKEKRLRDQFVRLETLISQFKGVSDSLAGQLATLPKIGAARR